MSNRTRVRAATWCKRLVLLQSLLIAACAPDYTHVRDWAGTASFAADYPAVALGRAPEPDPILRPAPAALPANAGQNQPAEAPNSAGIVAMQEALATYLTSLSTLAADGVLPYPEDPFVELAARAGQASEPGGRAVAELGALLRRSTRINARAPQMRATIAAADEAVQTLVTALSDAIVQTEPMATQARLDLAATYAQMEREAREPGTRQSIRHWAALFDREFAAQAAVRMQYRLVLTRIAEGHTLLKARAGHMTQEETARLIRAQADRLQRASAMLPRAPLSMPQREGIGSSPGRSEEAGGGRVPAEKRDPGRAEAGE